MAQDLFFDKSASTSMGMKRLIRVDSGKTGGPHVAMQLYRNSYKFNYVQMGAFNLEADHSHA
jgi:hypothetical protein